MAVLVFGVPLKGSFAAALLRRVALCRHDDRLWHVDLVLRQYPDRGAVWDGHPHGSARDAILRA